MDAVIQQALVFFPLTCDAAQRSFMERFNLVAKLMAPRVELTGIFARRICLFHSTHK